jgi:hypothetical protein
MTSDTQREAAQLNRKGNDTWFSVDVVRQLRHGPHGAFLGRLPVLNVD